MDTADMFFICMMLSLNTVLTAVTVAVLLHGNATRKDDSGYVDMKSFPSDFRSDSSYNDRKEARYQYVRSTLSKETFILDTYTGNLTKINLPVFRDL